MNLASSPWGVPIYVFWSPLLSAASLSSPPPGRCILAAQACVPEAPIALSENLPAYFVLGQMHAVADIARPPRFRV
jgi:hypothetical protein